MTTRYLQLLIKPPEGERVDTKMFREIINAAASQDGKPMAALVRDALLALPSVQTQMKIKLDDKDKSGEPK